MLIQGALLSSTVSTRDFLGHIAGHAPVHLFIVEPPPGIVMAAAVDWRVVIPDASFVRQVAEGIWSGYDTLIRSGATLPSTGVLVQCRNAKGQFDQFIIGKDVVDAKDLVKRVADANRLLKPCYTALGVKQMIEATEESGYWERFEP